MNRAEILRGFRFSEQLEYTTKHSENVVLNISILLRAKLFIMLQFGGLKFGRLRNNILNRSESESNNHVFSVIIRVDNTTLIAF